MKNATQRTDSDVARQRQPILRAHMPELDSIRGLAILGVLCYHGLYWTKDLSQYTPWQRLFLQLMAPGQFGVNLFFVLSGFLITGILLDSRIRPDYYQRFYFRRALRILPAYYLTLMLLILFGMTSGGFLLMSLAYSANLSALFGISLSYAVLWSLAVEEHFYLLWPMAVKRMSPRKLLWVLGIILLLCPISRFLYHERAIVNGTVGSGFGYYTWNNLDGLALGAIVAILARREGWDRRQMLRLSVFFITAAVLVTVAGYPLGILTRRSAMGDALQYVPWNLAFAGVVGIFLLIGSSRWKRIVTPGILIFFGQISYGLYLYHVMVFTGFGWVARRTDVISRFKLSPWEQTCGIMVLGSAVAIVLAYMSRRYFEERFLSMKDRVRGRTKQGSTDSARGTHTIYPPAVASPRERGTSNC